MINLFWSMLGHQFVGGITKQKLTSISCRVQSCSGASVSCPVHRWWWCIGVCPSRSRILVNGRRVVHQCRDLSLSDPSRVRYSRLTQQLLSKRCMPMSGKSRNTELSSCYLHSSYRKLLWSGNESAEILKSTSAMSLKLCETIKVDCVINIRS